MSNLYIIGNGFDLHHGLKTKYRLFGAYLEQTNPNLYDDFIEYYNLAIVDYEDDDSLQDLLWGDFENILAELDFERILDENRLYLPDYGSDDFKSRDYHAYQFQMEGIVEKLTNELSKAFKQFILNVEFPTLNKKDLLKIDKNAIFINFNYTETLEKYNGIGSEKILYIHGKANSDEKLILGHGIDPDSFKSKKEVPPEGLSKEELSDWNDYMSDQYDYAFDTGRDELISYFKKSHKSTSEMIERNAAFFGKIKSIKNIYILGHSMSDVDMPYFRYIRDKVDDCNTNWFVSYYMPDDKDYLKNSLLSLDLDEAQINLITLNELKSN